MAGLKVRDVARRLNVSEKTVYKWLRQGLIPASRIGKTWIVTEEALQGILGSSQPGPVASTTPPFVRVPQPHSVNIEAAEDSVFGDGQHMEAAAARFSRMISSSVGHGIMALLGPRRLDPHTPAAIASELEAAEGEVLLQGVGLREFFGDRDHTTILRRMAVEDRPVSVRALLVDPTGQFARARTVVQDGEQYADDALFRAGPLFGDSWRSLNVIASLKKISDKSRRFRLDVRFLDHWPSAYLVLTNRSAFVETYHFGRTDQSSEQVTIDGLVPMLQIDSESNYYALLRNHFDYLWNGTNPFVPSLTLDEVARSVRVDV